MATHFLSFYLPLFVFATTSSSAAVSTEANMNQILWFLLLSPLILLLIFPPKQTCPVFPIQPAECPSLIPTQSAFLLLLFLSPFLYVCVCTVFWACGPSHTPAGPNTNKHKSSFPVSFSSNI